MKKSIACFLTFFISQCIITNAFSQTYSWYPKANFGGSGRYGAFSFSIAQYGYIGGGYDGSTLSDMWQYNPSTDSWTQKASIPIPIRTAGSFVISGKGYVVGGLNNSSTHQNGLFEYDPTTNVWTQKTSFPGAARYGGAAFSVNSKGYYGIGNTGSYLGPYYNDFYEYDPIPNTWTQKASFPGTARYGVYGIASSSYGYVGFGVNENTSTLFNDWYQYNPVSNTWAAKANYPDSARNYPTGFYLDGKIFVGTGQSYFLQFSNFYKYDEINNTWTPEVAYGGGKIWLPASFAIGNKAYIGTGYNSSAGYHNDFWEFSADTNPVINQTCITLRPGAAEGKDAVIHSGLPNFNSQPHINLGASAWTCSGPLCLARSLFEFNLSSIPANATIVDARLDLYASQNPLIGNPATTGSNNACYLQRVTAPWVENSVTWNNQPAVTGTNQVTLPQSTSSSQNYLNVNVTNLVKDMVSNGNYGFLIKEINEAYYNCMIFTSSDDADTTRHPALKICYTLPIEIADSVSVPSCFGGNNGSIHLIVAGDNPPFTYLWNSGSTAKNRNNLKAKTYTVIVTDSQGNTLSKTIIVSQPAKLAITFNKTNVKCGGQSTGSATANVAGGIPPYSFLWSTGATTNTIATIPTGTYSVTVTDFNKCSAVKSVFISENPILSLTAALSGGNSATAQGSGGLPPYSYRWFTSPNQLTSTATGLIGGNTYQVKVTDSKYCTTTIFYAHHLSKRATDLNEENEISIAPNPTTGLVTVNFEKPVSDNHAIKLFDVTGKLLFEKEVIERGENVNFDFSGLQKGVYVLSISDVDKTKMIKLVRN